MSEQALETAAEQGSGEDDAAAIADAGDDQSSAFGGAHAAEPELAAEDFDASEQQAAGEQGAGPDQPDGGAEGGELAAAAGQASLELADPARLRGALEAVLLVVDEPVSAVSLAQTLAVPPPDVQAGLADLRDEYERDGRGIDLREVAGGWRMYSREDYAEYVEQFVLDGQRTRLTQAALETLAVIAYRQPVARSRVSAIRGVGVDGVMRTLITRGLIAEAGLDPESGAGLFVTTPLFLEKLGLNSLDELPPLGPLLPDHTDLDAEQDVDTDLVRPSRSSGAEADQPPINVSADD